MNVRSGIALAVLLAVSTTATAQPALKSLRGAAGIEEEVSAVDMKQVQPEVPPIERNYVQQPPLIPHSIRHYEIDLHYNKCLECHSWKNYREFGATKISQTHFTDSNGVDLADVSPRRYFCTQCHVTQAEAQPLIENDFTRVGALSK